MGKDLVLKNAQVISSGSRDSKEHPLSLSATFEAQDFSTPSNSKITVTVKDDANNSYPETKRSMSTYNLGLLQRLLTFMYLRKCYLERIWMSL